MREIGIVGGQSIGSLLYGSEPEDDENWAVWTCKWCDSPITDPLFLPFDEQFVKGWAWYLHELPIEHCEALKAILEGPS